MKIGDSPIYDRSTTGAPTPGDGRPDDPIHSIPPDLRRFLDANPNPRVSWRDTSPVSWMGWPWIVGMLLWWPLGIVGALFLLRDWRMGYRGILAGVIGIAVMTVLLVVNSHLHPPLF